MSKFKRGTTNVIATMLIFSIMIASMAVLYSQISPTLFGYEAEVEASNQEFVMLSVANSVVDLASSSEGSQTRVNIVSQSAIYSVTNGYSLSLAMNDGGTPFASLTTNIGSFNGNISSNFHETRGSKYYGRVQNEDTMISTNTSEATNFISKGEFLDDSIRFSLFFKVRMDIHYLPGGEVDVSFIIIKLVFQQDNFDFPVDLDQWTLRLVRRATVITEIPQATITGPITLSESVDGSLINSIDLSFLDGETIRVKFIEVPILFSI